MGNKGNRGLQIVLDVIGWIFGGIFGLWALMILILGNFPGAFLTILFAFCLTPLRRMLFHKFGWELKKGKLFALLAGLYLTSCGVSIGMMDTTVNESVSGNTISENDYMETEGQDVQSEDSIAEEETNEEKAIENTLEGQPNEEVPAETEEALLDEMQVHFIDVGQGDATFIICGDQTMLIDAGDEYKGTAIQNYLKKRNIEKLDYLILTHADADHIGGADVIVTKYDMENVFLGNYEKDTKAYDELIGALEYKNIQWSTPDVGTTYELGSATFTIIAPNRIYNDSNNSSIALLIQNGNDRFLFIGDAEEQSINDMLTNGMDIDCDVFHVGHHGGKESNSKELLERITPVYAVISCGENNSYGHPSAEVMNNLRDLGVKVYRTDEQGSIIAKSGGNGITWNCMPSDTWKAGESTGNSNSDYEAGTVETVDTTTQQVNASEPENSVTQEKASSADTAISEPAVAEQPTVVEPASGTLVWKSATGSKYHTINNCGNMNPAKAVQITKEQAVAMGLEPCSKCY